MPAPNEAVLTSAVPLIISTGGPKLEPSTTNWMVPDGVVEVDVFGVTVAVNVTESPPTEGFIEEATVVVVSALVTVTDSFGSPHAVVTALLSKSPV